MADDPAWPRRRRFSPEYKLAILAEYDRLTEPGDKGALLRREGLYTSQRGQRAAVQQVTGAVLDELVPLVQIRRACALLGLPRASLYRRCRPAVSQTSRPRPALPNALTPAGRQQLLGVLHEPRFCDLPPAPVWARLLDEGTYLASISTMYRLLRAHGEHRDRRRQRTHPATAKPQLLARKPNDLWSWDITKLPGPQQARVLRLVRDLGHLQPARTRVAGRPW